MYVCGPLYDNQVIVGNNSGDNDIKATMKLLRLVSDQKRQEQRSNEGSALPPQRTATHCHGGSRSKYYIIVWYTLRKLRRDKWTHICMRAYILRASVCAYVRL